MWFLFTFWKLHSNISSVIHKNGAGETSYDYSAKMHTVWELERTGGSSGGTSMEGVSKAPKQGSLKSGIFREADCEDSLPACRKGGRETEKPEQRAAMAPSVPAIA